MDAPALSRHLLASVLLSRDHGNKVFSVVMQLLAHRHWSISHECDDRNVPAAFCALYYYTSLVRQ